MIPLIEMVNFALVCGLVGLTLFLIVQSIIRSHELPFIYLAIFLIAIFFGQVDEIVSIFEIWRAYPWLMNMYIPALYLLAPSIYLYIKALSVKQKGIMFRFVDVNWLGFVMAILLCLPYYFLDQQIKLERLLAPAGSLQHLSYITIAPKVALVGFVPFSLFYLFVILKTLSQHLVNIKAYFSNIEDKNLSWVRWSIILLLFALSVGVAQLFLPKKYSNMGFYKFIFLCYEYAWLFAFGILSLKQQIIYNKQNNNGSKTKKYSHTKISEEDARRIQNKLISAMEKKKLHYNASLTLRELSDFTGVSENKISQVLNTIMEQSFYQFINNWRIKDACQYMEDSNLNILEIAYLVGFNSRSTFNMAFKKKMGKTPSAYRVELQTIVETPA